MIPWWWSWLLTAIGVTGLLIAGNRRSWGWLVNLGAQVFWIVYAITSHQWGFIASAVAYGAVYARNYLKWRRERTWASYQCADCRFQFEAFLDDRRRCPNCGGRQVWVRGVKGPGVNVVSSAPAPGARSPSK